MLFYLFTIYNLYANKVSIKCKSDQNIEAIIQNTNENFSKIVSIQKHNLIPCRIFNAHGMEHMSLIDQVPIKPAIKTFFRFWSIHLKSEKVSESHLHIIVTDLTLLKQCFCGRYFYLDFTIPSLLKCWKCSIR